MNEDPLIGKTIGNFYIERLLGRGGMAQVYYGQDIKLQRPVAIKVIDPRYRGKTSQARRFVKEARVMAKWKHENIVQIFSADDEGELYYYVMEYVEGQDLSFIMSSYAKDGELMPIADVIRIGRAIANALDYAHEQKIIHRDVKPSNVLVAVDGRVMLSDFGLALDMSDGSEGEVFGTAHYISPEQAQHSSDAVPQSDLYSFGVILYEMLTGVVPFTDPSPASVALQHITQPPPSPRSKNPEISAEVETILLKALQKEPEKRFQTGKELMDALEEALTHPKPTTAMSLPPLPIGVPTVKRRTVSQNSVAERVTGQSAEGTEEPTVRSAGTVQRELSNRAPAFAFLNGNARVLWVAALFLVCILSLAFVWVFKTSIFRNLPAGTAPSATVFAANSSNLGNQIPVSGTATVTSAAILATASPESTQTSAPTASPTITVIPTATVRFPDGNRFLFLYNNNSFFMVNKSKVTRSISAFTFERLDDQGNTAAVFYGWYWERYYPNLSPKRCMGIFIVNSPPYLEPVECGKMYISVLNYERDEESLFWTTQDNSHQFRVLWKDEEAGRCEIDAGACEVRVP